jgi:hypothetical protein
MSRRWASPSIEGTTKHCRHLTGKLQTGYLQSFVPRVLRQRRPILFGLNLDSQAEVDALFAQWKAAQAKIVSEPEEKPWKLREFMAADLDGNPFASFMIPRRHVRELCIAQSRQVS